jgi:hypothetical protein
MSPPTNNWGQRRTEHRFYAEIVIELDIQLIQTTKIRNEAI